MIITGKKIDSIKEMYSLGLPAPKCVFIMEQDNVDARLDEYFKMQRGKDLYCIRTDSNKSSMSCKRNLSASREELIESAHEWHHDFQVILQGYVGDQNEVKSGNIYLNDNIIVIEGAKDKHHIFTNGWSLDVNLIVPRFESYCYQVHKRFQNQNCFNISEIIRLIRLARKVPYKRAIIEFSYINDGNLYFWEIKKELQA